MKRTGIGILAAASLIACAAFCASSSKAFEPVALTKDSALVAGCEQLKPVTAEARSNDTEAFDEMSHEARQQGANYVLVAAEGARTRVAYRCSTPAQPGEGR